MSIIDARPIPLYSSQEIQQLEKLLFSSLPPSELMERAGKCAFDLVVKTWPSAKRILVVCGGGNNGGDGYVMARHAHLSGFQVTILNPLGPCVTDPGSYAFKACEDLPIRFLSQPSDISLYSFDLIVDALMGIGYGGSDLKPQVKETIHVMNGLGCPILSLDCPSGLNVTTGWVHDCAVKATITLTFIGRKVGLYTGLGPDYCGTITCADLDVSSKVFQEMQPTTYYFDIHEILKGMSPRKRTSYKNTHGHVLIIGGNHGYAGAVHLAALGALRSGAGLVSVATRKEHVMEIVSETPELMIHGVESIPALSPLIDRASVVVIGPGLGQDSWAKDLFEVTLTCSKPLVVDADALNLLSQTKTFMNTHSILTPHPGEAARLLSTTVEGVQQNRFEAIEKLVQTYGTMVVLKGPGTLIGGPNTSLALCPYGNPGMATGGMGDLLSGIIAGLLAQGLTIEESAIMGTYIHSYAADLAAQEGERGMIATDLLPFVRQLVNDGIQDAK